VMWSWIRGKRLTSKSLRRGPRIENSRSPGDGIRIFRRVSSLLVRGPRGLSRTFKPMLPVNHSALFLSCGPEMKRSRNHVAPEGRRPGRASRLIDRPCPTRPTATPRRIGTADGRSHSTRDGRAHYGSSTWRLRQLPSSSATSTVSFLNPVISVTSTCVSKVLKPSTRLSKRHV